MGEARRKRLFGIGPVRVTPAVDVDDAIADFERHVEDNQVVGFVQLGLLQNIAPNVSPIKMWTMGLEKQQVYDMLCEMKKAMEDTMGFKDD